MRVEMRSLIVRKDGDAEETNLLPRLSISPMFAALLWFIQVRIMSEPN